MTDPKTSSRHYPKPSPEHFLQQDVVRLASALDAIDDDMAQLFAQAARNQRRIKLNQLIGETLFTL